MNNAEILSEDNSLRPCWADRPCDCPGGYLIHIDNVPDPHGTCIFCSSFKTMHFPTNFNLTSNPRFPIAVKIDWKFDAMLCDSSHINILSITRR